jgi:predicted anti-sigma-YlaC factor YlaD
LCNECCGATAAAKSVWIYLNVKVPEISRLGQRNLLTRAPYIPEENIETTIKHRKKRKAIIKLSEWSSECA